MLHVYVESGLEKGAIQLLKNSKYPRKELFQCERLKRSTWEAIATMSSSDVVGGRVGRVETNATYCNILFSIVMAVYQDATNLDIILCSVTAI